MHFGFRREATTIALLIAAPPMHTTAKGNHPTQLTLEP
jgi:hypothetical protein